jgi:hypothetical protein
MFRVDRLVGFTRKLALADKGPSSTAGVDADEPCGSNAEKISTHGIPTVVSELAVAPVDLAARLDAVCAA